MKKILPIDEHPEFKEVHTSAYILSILKASGLFSKKWLLKNCIPIFFAKKFSHTLSYAYHPFWFFVFFKSCISLYYYKKDIIKRIKQYIDLNYYIILCVNERYIPYRKAYKNRDYYHDILIYGYDEKNESFYTIAYDDAGKYCTHTISFNQIEMAYRNHPDRFYRFYALKVNKNYDFDSISVKSLLRRIKRHLRPIRNNRGINAYKHFRKMLLEAYEFDYKEVDIRGFRLIMERAQALKLLNEYFVIDSSIKNELDVLVQLSKSLFYLALKYNITQSRDILFSIINHYDETIKIEQDFFSKVLSEGNNIQEKI